MTDVRVIGVGNVMRGDDAVGLIVARRLVLLAPRNVDVVESGGAVDDLLHLVEGARVVILIDAARSGATPGTVHRRDLSQTQIGVERTEWPRSSHALTIIDVLELARVLGTLPSRVIVFGIEIVHTDFGQGLSAAVAEGVQVLVEDVLREIQGAACTSSMS